MRSSPGDGPIASLEATLGGKLASIVERWQAKDSSWGAPFLLANSHRVTGTKGHGLIK